MELQTKFETWIQLDDETEYNVEVECSGEYIEDGFSHEFGYEESFDIDNVTIETVYNLETEELIPVGSISKKEFKKLKDLAYDYLMEEMERYDESDDLIYG